MKMTFHWSATCAGFMVCPARIKITENKQINTAVTTVYYTYFAVCAASLICVLLFFPSRPPSPPPAASSALARDVSLLAGLLALARNAKFWAAVFCMSVPSHVRAGSDARHSNE